MADAAVKKEMFYAIRVTLAIAEQAPDVIAKVVAEVGIQALQRRCLG